MPLPRSPVVTRHKKQPTDKASTSDDAPKTPTSSTDQLSTKSAPITAAEGPCTENQENRPPTNIPSVSNVNGSSKGEENSKPVNDKGEVENPVSQKNRKASRKLDDTAFKPWGECTLSRSSSDTSSASSSETSFCKGGPGKESCGDPVLEGESGVRCDSCLSWYHSSCQGISMEAVKAIEEWHPVLSWFCSKCKSMLKKKDKPASDNKLGELEAKIVQLSNSVCTHMKSVEQCLKEQERTATENRTLIERVIKENHQQKVSYAEIVKGSCTEVLNKVSSQIVSLTPSPESSSKGSNRPAQDLSVAFDEYVDKEKRKLNVVVHNMNESDSDVFEERAKHDASSFEKMVRDVFRLNLSCVRSFRAGKKLPGKNRLLIVTLESVGIRQELLRMAPQLRGCEGYNTIYINPDLTPKEREQGKKLREELTTRRQNGETNLTIRKGRVVCATPNNDQVPSQQSRTANNRRDAGSASVDAQGGGAVSSQVDQQQ